MEDNKLIAEFMGFVESPTTNKYWTKRSSEGFGIGELVDLKFHTDWNWLMEVVEKIESLTDINSNGCFMLLESIGFNAKFIFDDGTRILKDSKGETKFGAVYNACVEFIKWYNNGRV